MKIENTANKQISQPQRPYDSFPIKLLEKGNFSEEKACYWFFTEESDRLMGMIAKGFKLPKEALNTESIELYSL